MCDKTTDKERKCYAAIDIGSNAVRLLIKKEDEDENLVSRRLAKALLLRVPLRLGFDVFALGELSEKKAKKLRRLMKAFRQLMKIYEVTDYRACATSAMRDARNGKSVISRILKDSGPYGKLHLCGRGRRKHGDKSPYQRAAGAVAIVQHRYGEDAQRGGERGDVGDHEE